MPRTYVPKSKVMYSKNDLNDVLTAIRNNQISVLQAAKDFKIPQATIYARLSGRRGDNPRGRKTVLSKEEEVFLVHAIQTFQQWQQPMTPATVMRVAKEYMVQLGKKISVKTTLRDWFAGFMKRWTKELKVAKTMNLEKVRSKSCTKAVVGEWSHGRRTRYNVFFRWVVHSLTHRDDKTETVQPS